MTPWAKLTGWLDTFPVHTVEAVYRWATILTIVAGAVTVFCAVVQYLASNRLQALEALADARRDGHIVRIDEQRAALAAELEEEREMRRLGQEIAEQRERERSAIISSLRDELVEAKASAAEAERNVANATRHSRPREITAAQRQQFLALVGDGPKGPITVGRIQGDAEIGRYYAQMIDLVTAGGWTVTDRPLWLDLTFEGVFIRVRSAETAPSRARLLQDALKAIGVVAHGEVSQDLPAERLELMIGHQPIIPAAKEQ